jgi:hypothetical protein
MQNNEVCFEGSVRDAKVASRHKVERMAPQMARFVAGSHHASGNKFDMDSR